MPLRGNFCITCWGRGWRTVIATEPVPHEELEDWQLAELMVNGGEYYPATKVPCEDCGETGREP